MRKILVLNGPNLNLLGLREPTVYGTQTLDGLNKQLITKAQAHDVTLECQQHQAEAALIEAMHQAHRDTIDFVILNPAAFTHTSIALRDAMLAVNIPFIEVHISNPLSRESFRHTSYFSDIARGVITGLGTYGYLLALDAIIHEFTQ
ncbi:MAG: type II 3-dehydroquinate dehydratase [Legionellaceae bacterium]|nr:type II 3-dehydroquinate dehydratase [Legionellaceae bacterium]